MSYPSNVASLDEHPGGRLPDYQITVHKVLPHRHAQFLNNIGKGKIYELTVTKEMHQTLNTN